MWGIADKPKGKQSQLAAKRSALIFLTKKESADLLPFAFLEDDLYGQLPNALSIRYLRRREQIIKARG